jgi:regulator of protease activity HflC (stomatin/prohibitin superfamily)
MKFTLKTAIIGISVVLLIVLYNAFYTLEEGLQAIVVQFGRTVGEPVTEAGLHIKLPFVQEVRRFEKRLLVWDGDPNQIPTKGREFIWVDTTARWRVTDAKRFLENVASEEGAKSRLNDILDSVVRDQVSSSELVELVRSASWEVPKDEALKDIPKEREEELKKEIARGREEITRTILTEAQKIIPQYGIELASANASPRSSARREKDAVRRSSGRWKKSCARSAPRPTAAYRRSKARPTQMRRAFTAKLTIAIPNSTPSCAPLKATKRKRIRIPC